MKNLKKILSIVACSAMLLVSSLIFTGCKQEDLKETTESVIESTTNIIPVELSKETAMGMLTTAYRNFIRSEAYEVKYENFADWGEGSSTEIGMLSDKMLVGGSITKLSGRGSTNPENLNFEETIKFEVNYTNVDTSMIVTSLEGFTAEA